MALPLIAAVAAGGTSLIGSMLQNAQSTAYNRAFADYYRTQARLTIARSAQ